MFKRDSTKKAHESWRENSNTRYSKERLLRGLSPMGTLERPSERLGFEQILNKCRIISELSVLQLWLTFYLLRFTCLKCSDVVMKSYKKKE